LLVGVNVRLGLGSDLALTLLNANKTTTEEKLEVNILTYNLCIRPPGIKANDGDYKSERLQVCDVTQEQ